MHVARQCQQILVPFHQSRLVAPVQQMPVPSMPKIKVDRVSRRKAMHKPTKISLGRFQNQVEMIVHQGQQIESDFEFPDLLAQFSQKTEPIPIILEEPIILQVPIPQLAPGHMVYGSRELHSQRSCHLPIEKKSSPSRKVLFQGQTPKVMTSSFEHPLSSENFAQRFLY